MKKAIKVLQEVFKVFASLGIALLVVEFALAVATPVARKAAQSETPGVPTTASEKTVETKQEPAIRCSSEFLAVFRLDDQILCTPNPTMQIAAFGPPDEGWFMLSGGEFQLSRADLLPMEVCERFSDLPPYGAQGTWGPDPVSQLLFEGRRYPLTWVCADHAAVIEGGRL